MFFDRRLERAWRRILSDPLGSLASVPGRIGYAHARAGARKAVHAVQLGNGLVLCRILGRYRMVVSGDDEGFGLHLIGEGFWELGVTRYMARRIRPGMACIDVGANAGYFAVLLADLTGPSGSLLALEPHPGTAALLARNLRLNGVESWSTIRQAAIGAKAGEAVLMVPEGEPKNATVQPEGADYSHGRPHQTIRAPMLRLDDLDIGRLDFMKIDIEGAEQEAWAGMQATLDRFPGAEIVLEVNNGRYADPAAFYTAIAGRYRLRKISFTGALEPTTIAELAEAPPEDVMLVLRAT